MRGSSGKFGQWCAALALAGVGSLLMSQPVSAADDSKATIKFTEPVSKGRGINQTNTYQALDVDSLNHVRKPYEPFNAADSFSGAMSPPPSYRGPQLSPAAMRKMQDALDRKKNWAFLTPEEVYGIQTPEEIMNVPEYDANGQRITQPKTTIERYMQRMENSRLIGQSNRLSGERLTDGEKEENEKKKKLEEKEKPSLNILASPITSPALANGFLNPSEKQGYLDQTLTATKSSGEGFNFEGFLPKENALARTPMQESRMQEFKQMMESRPALTPAQSQTPTFTPPPVTPSAFSGLANPGALPSLSGTPIPPPSLNPNGTVLGAAVPSYIPAYTPPPATPRYVPSRPIFDPPARKF